MTGIARIRPCRAGFTILEILVAVAIFAMISTIVFGTFFYTIDNAERQEERAALYHRAGFILSALSRSVSSAYVPYAGAYVDEGSERSVFLGETDTLAEMPVGSLSMFTTDPRTGGGAPGAKIAYVSYAVVPADEIDAIGWIEDKDNPLTLSCTAEPLLLDPVAEGESDPQWTLNVRALKLEYFDGSGWLDNWDYEDQGVLPDAVRLELELADSSGETHSFSTLAYIHVNTLLEEPREVPEEEEEEAEEEEEEVEEETPEEAPEPGEPAEGRPPSPFGPEPSEPPGDGWGIFPETPGTFPFG